MTEELRIRRFRLVFLAICGHSALSPGLPCAEVLDLDASDFFDVVVAPQYQRTVNQGDYNLNYELSVLGVRTLSSRAGAFGDTAITYWFLRNDTIAGLPTGEFSANAGLLWETNGGDAPEPSNFLGVLAFHQAFFDGSASMNVGKLFPGTLLAVSDYSGDDRATFMSNIVASDSVGRYFDAIGLGLSGHAHNDNWFGTVLVTDAAAESDFLDFDSLSRNEFLYSVEFGWTPHVPGELVATWALYHMDADADLTAESGAVVAFTWERTDGRFAAFGRYTFRDGGESRNQDVDSLEQPLAGGGFLGAAWNAPLGREHDQAAIAFLYGKPNDARRQQGFSEQFGIEIYWNISTVGNLQITPDLQILKNRADNTEFVYGVRLRWNLD